MVSLSTLREYIEVLREPVGLKPMRHWLPSNRLSEAIRFSNLRRGVKSIPSLAAATSHFIMTHSTVCDQKFDDLVTVLCATADNEDDAITTGTEGYAAASQARPNAVFTQSMEDQLVARITATVLAALLSNVPHQHRRGKGWSSKTSQYCFTNGHGGHSSEQCHTRSRGHKEDATQDNKWAEVLATASDNEGAS